MRSKTFDRRDLHRTVTDTIVAQLEAGTAPWARPWSTGRLAGPISRPLRANGQPYRGINVLMLWLTAAAKGYASPTWMTFKQALKFGGYVRRGDASYALEELVAEVGAAFLGADFGLEPTPREDHARTIASWIEVLKRDPRVLFTAAGHAQRAVDFLQARQPAGRRDEDEPPTGAG